MYRRVKGKVCGVLTDYDLSSWTESMKPGYSKTSQQRTGTPPYMAQELLMGTSPVHLYRHDVESLFYVMLLMAARHKIETPKGEKKPRVLMRGIDPRELPYEKWFNQQDYEMLGSLKSTFFLEMKAIELSQDFKDFRPWLRGLQLCFSNGFKLRPSPKDSDDDALDWVATFTGGGVKPPAVQYDDETLGGSVQYATILAPIPSLKGALEGLAVRYPIKSSSAPAPSTSPVAA